MVVDETYVKVAGRWIYLYRAIDQVGQVIDVLASKRRDLATTRRFFTRALSHSQKPAEVTTDRAPAYPRVLDEQLPTACPVDVARANNRIESDHSRPKARLRPMHGPKHPRSAQTISSGHALIQNIGDLREAGSRRGPPVLYPRIVPRPAARRGDHRPGHTLSTSHRRTSGVAHHVDDQYANNPIEADHSRPKARLRPMRGLKHLRSAQIISSGHAVRAEHPPQPRRTGRRCRPPEPADGCLHRAHPGHLTARPRGLHHTPPLPNATAPDRVLTPADS